MEAQLTMTHTSRKAHKDQPDELKQHKASDTAGPEIQVETAPFDPHSATPEQWLAMLDSKETEIVQLKDRVLRMGAEMENTRKRLERERTDSVNFANESIIRELLPIVDNLERALEHAQTEAHTDSLTEGVSITLKAFRDALARFGCASFEAHGMAFDPNFHEAVMQEESRDYAENTVLRELQKGYTLHNRLLRPAMVVVSKAAADAKPPTPEKTPPKGAKLAPAEGSPETPT
jgi:molecular chaperone GrpE